MSIGSRLKEARLLKGYTQQSLADLLNLSKGAIGNYEANISVPKTAILAKLMDVLEVDANYLYQDLSSICKRMLP